MAVKKKKMKKVAKIKKAIKPLKRVLVKKRKIIKPISKKKNVFKKVINKKRVVLKKNQLKKKIKLVKLRKVKKIVIKNVKKKIVVKKFKNSKQLVSKKKIPHAKIKHSNKKINKKKTPSPVVSEFPAESLFKAKIKVIGIGGGGGSIVSEIGRSLEKATFVIADTDIRALKKRQGIKYFWFGENMTHGLGTGVNVELAKEAAEESREKISSIFKDQDIIIFIASLGGGLGSGATQVFAEAAREFGGITLGIFTMPFKFEGKNKQRIAQNALKSLKQSLNVSLTIPNERIFKIIDTNTPITEAFSIVNKSLIESLESLIDLIYNPGIINIDFADLRTILKGRGNSAFLNTVEESGKNRTEKICEKVLVNPLLQNSNFEAEKILFNIAGSENLSMFEVEKISKHIADLNPKAKIIFGISKNSKLKNKIKTTILMTGQGVVAKEKAPKEKIEAVKVIAKEDVKIETKKEEEKVIVKDKFEEKPKKDKQDLKGTSKKEKKVEVKKEVKIKKKNQNKKKKSEDSSKAEEQIRPFLPVFNAPVFSPPVSLEERKLNIIEVPTSGVKKSIRRSALEIKKAQELEENKKLQQEKEWEIPAFLRRVKFKS